MGGTGSARAGKGRCARQSTPCPGPIEQVRAPRTFARENAICGERVTNSMPDSGRPRSTADKSLASSCTRSRAGRWYAALPMACALAACRTKKNDMARVDSGRRTVCQKLASSSRSPSCSR